MFNKVLLIGHLGQNPQLKDSNGTKRVVLSLATNRRWKDKNGELQETVDWHTIVCWDKLAELCQSYLTRGAKIHGEGRL